MFKKVVLLDGQVIMSDKLTYVCGYEQPFRRIYWAYLANLDSHKQ